MKQYLIIFLICFLALFFLGTGIFGVNGYLYNENLKKQIRSAEYNKDKLEVEINSMKEQKSHLSSVDGLRNLANDLGYYVDGDTVYLFEESSLQDSVSVSDNKDVNEFKALSSGSILLIDLGVSVILTFIIWLLSRNRKHYYSDNVDEDSDSDIYINA